VIEMSARLASWLPGATTLRRSPAANATSLAKLKVAALADAAKLTVLMEAPFLWMSRSAWAVGAVPA
jgi:hypothetical protein